MRYRHDARGNPALRVLGRSEGFEQCPVGFAGNNLLQVLSRSAHGFTNPRNFEARGILVT